VTVLEGLLNGARRAEDAIQVLTARVERLERRLAELQASVNESPMNVTSVVPPTTSSTPAFPSSTASLTVGSKTVNAPSPQSAAAPPHPPNRSAAKTEWVNYAVERGTRREDAEACTKEDLISTFADS